MSVRQNILLKIRNSAVLAYDSKPLIISANVFHKKEMSIIENFT